MQERNRRTFEHFKAGADTIPAKKLNALVDGMQEVFDTPQFLPTWKPDYAEEEQDFPFKTLAYCKDGQIEISVSAGMWLGNGETHAGRLQSDSWLLKGDGIGERPPMKFSVAIVGTAWVVLSASVSGGVISSPSVSVISSPSYSSGAEFGIIRIPIAQIKTEGGRSRVTQYLSSDFCFGASMGGGSGDSHPFKITYDRLANRVSITGGYWIGDGVSAKGMLDAQFINSENAQGSLQGGYAWRDMFRVPAIVDMSLGEFSSETVYFYVGGKEKYGRIYGVGDDKDYLMINAVGSRTHESEFEAIRRGMNPSVRFIGSVDLLNDSVHQYRRDNIVYEPQNQAGIPLFFYPKEDALDTFECLGGLLRINLNRVENGAVWEIGESGGNTVAKISNPADGHAPKKLQRCFAVIPPHEITLSPGSETERENYGNPINGYVVFLRVGMRYHAPDGQTENVYPAPSISWDFKAIPNGFSTVHDPWNFGQSELVDFADSERVPFCPQTFLGMLEGMPIVSVHGADTTENAVLRIDGGLYVQTEQFEAIIPVGVFYRPYLPASVAVDNPDMELAERYLYAPVHSGGIIDWTPPIDFKIKFTTSEEYV